MGKVLIFSMAPTMLFILIGGVTGDRLSRVRLMLLSDIIRGLVLSVVTILAVRQQLEIWHIYVASALVGFVSAFFQPAYSAILPEVVPAESLPSANSLTSLSKQLSDILGPSLGAVLVGIGGTSIAFGANGISFFTSAAFLLPLLKTHLANRPTQRRQSPLVDFREGIAAVFRYPWLWISIAIFGLANITLTAPISVALPYYIKEGLHADVRLLGITYSMFAVGSLATTVWLGRGLPKHRRGVVLYSTVIVLGLATVALGLSASELAICGVVLIIGALLPVFGLVWTNILQELVSRDLLGRVSSIDYLGSAMFLPVGLGLIGWAANVAGAPLVFLIGGSCTMVLGALALLHPAIRNLD
jgi:predicted MFS family arabinose efflux permease